MATSLMTLSSDCHAFVFTVKAAPGGILHLIVLAGRPFIDLKRVQVADTVDTATLTQLCAMRSAHKLHLTDPQREDSIQIIKVGRAMTLSQMASVQMEVLTGNVSRYSV